MGEFIRRGLRGTSRVVLALPRYAKRLIALSVDISLCVLTVWVAFYLRLGEFVLFSSADFWATEWAMVISIIIALPIFVTSGLYRAIFRYAGFPAMFAITRAVVIYGLLYASIIPTPARVKPPSGSIISGIIARLI